MSMSSFVHITTRVEGLHHQPDPEQSEQYLRAPHRHLFVVTAQVQVLTHGLEIEINAAARWLGHVFTTLVDQPPQPGRPLDFGPQSCEQLARRLVDVIANRYGRDRQVQCVVTEDGLLGGGAIWDPERSPNSMDRVS